MKSPLSLVLLLLALLVGAAIRHSHRREDQARFTLSHYPNVESTIPRETFQAIGSRTLRLAFLIWRALSESNLHRIPTPPGKEVATRRVILSKLTELDLRNSLAEEELDLHLLPDGSWSSEQISSVLVRSAELQALRYCTGLDKHMEPIEDLNILPRIDVQSLTQLTPDSTWHFRPTYDIRKERDEAAAYFLRCLAEKRRRGLYQGSLTEDEQHLFEMASLHAGDENHDLLLGTDTVAEASEASLEMATAQSHIRFKTLNDILAELENYDNEVDLQFSDDA